MIRDIPELKTLLKEAFRNRNRVINRERFREYVEDLRSELETAIAKSLSI